MKICAEFVKRNDPELPFYYYTSAHARFYEEDTPDFNQPPKKQRELRRPPRRELLSTNAGSRVTFLVRGSESMRDRFHNVPVNLPPPPGSKYEVLDEHFNQHSSIIVSMISSLYTFTMSHIVITVYERT